MLRGVRGATTAISNDPEAIREVTRKLLIAMTKANAVSPNDIAAVIFSSTPDLNASFPAAAARELGWNEVPLFGTQEIECPTGIPLCVRVLILLNTDKSQQEIQSIYQAGAVVLRPDLSATETRQN
ncbi:MAG: chorismate mutase [Negativicutes bacterium]